MNAEVKKGLGRGLASLLGDDNQDYAQLDKMRSSKNVPTAHIRPGKFQPRVDFDAESLKQLADSIKAKGILQPLLVRRDPKNPSDYELIAGERRWRAAQLAQLHEVPVIIKEFTDQEALEIGLIENLQRQDLNPIEEAFAYARLMGEFDYTQDQVAKGLGKSRSYVSNIVRLLDLPESVRAMLRDKKLSAGQARLLVGKNNAAELAQTIIDKNLNVRQVEEWLSGQSAAAKEKTVAFDRRASFEVAEQNLPQAANQSAPGSKSAPRAMPGDSGPLADIRDLEKQLERHLGLRVEIKFTGKAGQISLYYKDLDQLDQVISKLKS